MLTLDDLSAYVDKAKLILELDIRYRTNVRRMTVKIYDHSPTAQPGYEYPLLFNHTGHYQETIDHAVAWVLHHLYKKR